MKFFLFQHNRHLWIVNDPQIVPKPRELLLQNSNIDIIRSKAEVLGTNFVIVDKVTVKKRKRLTEEHKRNIAKSLMGNKNPNWGGLKEETKAKIRRKMRGTRRFDANPMYARKHSAKTKSDMALKARLRRRAWCTEPSGKTHLIDPLTFVLPTGWVWGRSYDPYKY